MDGVPQELCASCDLFVVVGGKPRVQHIEFGDSPMPRRIVSISAERQPAPVKIDDALAFLPIWRTSGLNGSFQAVLDFMAQFCPRLVLFLR